MAYPGAARALIPAKKALRTIGRAVSSALAETAVGEVVVIDDGSTDDNAAALCVLSEAIADRADRLRTVKPQASQVY